MIKKNQITVETDNYPSLQQQNKTFFDILVYMKKSCIFAAK